MYRVTMALAIAAATGSATAAETVVFDNFNDNGWFTPFDSSTSSDVRYGDSGWIGTGASAPETLTRIELGLVTVGGSFQGSTDLLFSFHDGSASGLVFGSGAELWSTVVTIDLPQTDGGPTDPNFFTVSIDLPGIQTLGGFNNIGWAVGVDNYNFDGTLGFQAASANAQTAGFYTVNASSYDGTNWSLFSFGGDPVTGVANFVTTVYTPAPGAAGVLALAGLAATRRRR